MFTRNENICAHYDSVSAWLLLAERKRDKKVSGAMSGNDNVSATDDVVKAAADDALHHVPDVKLSGYVKAANKVKEVLKTSETPTKINSVLNSLRFYTRQEHLDDYFCTICNEGLLLGSAYVPYPR